MTKKELIDDLKDYPDDAMVYVPTNPHGCNGTVVFIATFDHGNMPDGMEGIRIPPDIALLPGNMEQFITDSEDLDVRMGNLSKDTPETWRRKAQIWCIEKLMSWLYKL